MKKMTMLQVARKFQENAIKATEHPILDKILAKNQTNKEIENSQKDIKSGYLGEEGDDVLVYTTNQTKKNTIKGVKAWAVFADDKLLDVWVDKKGANSFVELEINLGSFIEYKVIPVLITPITKVAKKGNRK